MSGVGGVGQTPEIPTVQPSIPDASSRILRGLGSILQHTKEQIQQGQKLASAAKGLSNWSGDVFTAAQRYQRNPTAANLEKLKAAVASDQGVLKEFKAAGLSTTGLQNSVKQLQQEISQIQPGQSNSPAINNVIAQVSTLAAGAGNLLRQVNQISHLANQIGQGLPPP